MVAKRKKGDDPPKMRSYAKSSEDTIAEIRKISPHCLISFSRGKDSIAAYLAIRDKFDSVTPYFYNVVPGLEFVEESLAYFEQKMGTRIIRLPAPGFYRSLNNLLYQPPDTIRLIEALDLETHSHDDMQAAVCHDAGLDPETSFNALGMRAKDSMQRTLYFQKNGPVNFTRKLFYPVWDWDKQRVIDTIKHHGWKLPVDYKYFSASFDGLYLRFMVPIKKYFPRDWEKIVNIYPLIEMEILRYEAAVAAGEQPPYTPPPGAVIHA